MDPEFGDDLLNGFSDEEIDYGEGEDGGEGEEDDGASGLDLLTAMLDSQAKEKHEAKKRGSIGRKRRSSGHERKDSQGEGGGGIKKRRKVTKREIEGIDHSEKSAESSDDEISRMKARMLEFERENKELREALKKQEQQQQQQQCGPNPPNTQWRPSEPLAPPTSRPSAPPTSRPLAPPTLQPSAPPTSRTEATRLPTAGERKRVARQPGTNQREGEGGRGRLGDVGPGTNGGAGGEGRGQRGVGDRGVANDINRQRQEDEQSNIITEKYSRLRIKNPLVSSETMRQRMDGRKMVSIPKLHSKVKDGDIEGDWVTIGVVVDKLPPRDTRKGDKYTIWKLSDLSSQTAVISLFLFGKCYHEHWKTSAGTVVALLNPSIMPGKESSETGPSGAASSQRYSSLALSLDNPLKLMVVGVSQDFTVCRAVTKSGKKCTNFASKANGSHCDYHVQSAYTRMRAQRMEFQTGYGPNPTKGKLRERLFKDSKTDVYYYGGRTFTDPGRSSSLSTSSSSRPGPNERGAPFERMFAPGAESTASRAIEELREKREVAGLGGVSTRGGVTTHQGSEMFKQMLQTQSIGARMLSKHFHKEDLTKKREEKALPPEKSASELLQEHKRTVVNATPLHRRPQLGRGMGGDGLIDLSDRRRATTANPTTKASLAKLKAVELMQKNGATEKEETKKSAAIAKRVEESRREEDKEEGCPDEAKKNRLDSAEFQRILKAKSSHDWIVKEEEREREEEYFDYLEKKENIEEKMASLKELRVNVVQCKTCKYIAESQSELCKKEQHRICRFKAVKKCFQCRGCRERCFAYNVPFPTDPCRRCGGMSYEATSFYRERKGPKLPTEQLLLRGEEEKFLNSLK